MADDSNEITEPLEFSPTALPGGMLWYDLKALNADQQNAFNDFKINVLRDDQTYLKSHPEVRGLTALLLRELLKKKPRKDLHEFAASFFSRSREEIETELVAYLKQLSKRFAKETQYIEKEDEMPGEGGFGQMGVEVAEEDDFKGYANFISETESVLGNYMFKDSVDILRDYGMFDEENIYFPTGGEGYDLMNWNIKRYYGRNGPKREPKGKLENIESDDGESKLVETSTYEDYTIEDTSKSEPITDSALLNQ